MSYVAGIGGANIDIHGRADGPVQLRDSNPGTLHLTMGGVMRNILENLARLGVSVTPACAVGDDLYGQLLRQGCKSLGMDTSFMLTRPGCHSSSYVSIMDDQGDMLVAMSDMHILKELDGSFVEECLAMLNDAKLVVCDGNLSADAVDYLTQHCKRPLYLDPVSTAWARELRPYVGRFHTIKPNRMEMEVLSDMTIRNGADLDAACNKLLGQGVQRLFVSLGRGGIFYKDADGSLYASAPEFNHLVNATGAGDATMAGIIYGTLHHYSKQKTLDTALAAGLVTIASPNTISEEMCPAQLKETIKEYLK